ncbi:hypothetical protein AB6A40_004769 [Gnathostoma spinigerum]|uniref:Uncharacterized protein n=1 Tax=Gnathostoma spinigerum TaxID=75299 RepID=A0ABD6EP77_9BILA
MDTFLIGALLSVVAAVKSMCMPGGAFGGYGGYGICPPDTAFYYYTCCEYNYMECCIHLQTWVIVCIVIFVVLILLCCCGCIAAAAFGFKRTSRNP